MDALFIKDDGFSSEKIADFGNKYFTGNGFMGIRGTLEEYTKEQMAAVNLSGVYDQHGTAWREPLNAPNPFYACVHIEGFSYALPRVTPASHEQRLDISSGLQSRKTVWNTPSGTLTVQAERFSSMADYHLLCMRYSVQTDCDAEICITTGIDADVWDINGPHYQSVKTDCAGSIARVLAVAGECETKVAVAQMVRCDFKGDESSSVTTLQAIRKYTVHAKAGETYSVSVFSGIYTSKDCDNPLKAAAHTAQTAQALGYRVTKQVHAEKWAQLWSHSRVLVEGDDEAQRALDYSIYHLHCIAPRYSKSMSIPARGLSGQTYKGAIFWDTEMFMLNFFLATEPEVAKTLLRYRIDTLDGAREKAKAYGFKGAFYAWESQEGGRDACSDYNVTDVFTGRPLRTYFRDKQVHISAAVVFAVMKYLNFTGDRTLLAEGGAEVILECARFYRSLLVRKADSEYYEIRDVLGPDEYHERVNNNAYTNRMAKFVFQAAEQVLEILRQNFPDVYHSLESKFDLGTESAKCSDSAQYLYIPQPDAECGIIEQFSGYFRLEDATPDTVRARLLHPKEYWGGADGVAAHTQVIKQADVVTMLSLFRDAYPKEILKQNWNYYEPRTEHGSSLSACMYALLACRFGEPELAYPFFLKSARADLDGGGKQWAGSVYIGGTHPAAAGGAWMTAVEGFGGMTVKNKSLLCTPCLPKGWKRLQFTVRVCDSLYAVDITPQDCKIHKK